MRQSTLIKNAQIVNDGKIIESDLRIKGQRIDYINKEILATDKDHVIDANGLHLLPGMIDDQVHFREPGLTHKGTIESESRAAVAGGITSYMEMPNVSPATTSIEALEAKFKIASKKSMANYSFYLGATEDNIEQIKQLDPKLHCGVKVFMGASTGDLLVEHPEALDAIFRESPTLIVTHCESTPVINDNLERIKNQGLTPTILDHPIIRDTAACYASSSYAVSLAKKYQSQLHVLHITTEKELSLFTSGAIGNKHITAEACVHHLWFSDQDYPRLGNLIKCNPAIKSSTDRDALIKAVQNNQIDIIATDHAPHTLAEKQTDYNHAPAGLPLVEHAILSLFEHVKHKRLSLEQVVEKTAHNPALRYGVKERGFIREGYYADLVLVNTERSTVVSDDNVHYHCAWTPFNDYKFSSNIQYTWVNGQQVFDGQNISSKPASSMRLEFNR
ncbi:dihydroorotase [Agarilytica rhodophyticola]|uniref:dihydroorotase n=1 Tax=Agarilytica rhodophyticola TaxID=1737490 RepID=UPI000B345E92|nr:dihydroorotase [Agarilytica rhodophyticola]